MRLIALAVLASLFLLLGAGCGSDDGGYVYQTPQQADDGWEVASLADAEMDTAPIVDMMSSLLEQDEHYVHSILVVRDGKLVFEEYFPGEDLDLTELSGGLAFSHKDFDLNTTHCLASASKSVTSILVGIAIDEGLVGGTNETMFSFFPDYSNLSDPVKAEITLGQMLAMTSGLPWNESYAYTDPRNDLGAMAFFSEDPIEYVLDKSTVAPPGTQFIYNSGTTNLLGEIVRRSSGLTLDAFADQHLFAPLGIDSFEWYGFPRDPEMTVASSALYLRPRDMAKLGQVYLDGGLWDTTRVVSESWVQASTSRAIDVPTSENPIPRFSDGYGFQWWLGTFSKGSTDAYFAAGWGGQFIIVLPEPEMVVVITAGDFENEGYDALLGLVDDYILAAVR